MERRFLKVDYLLVNLYAYLYDFDKALPQQPADRMDKAKGFMTLTFRRDRHVRATAAIRKFLLGVG